MISLKSIMTSNVVTVNPETVMFDAVALMEQNNISALVVVNKELPVGIFTERSLLRLTISGHFNPNQTIQEVMTTNPIIANSEINIHEAYLLFQKHKIRHLIIVADDGSLIGIATETDFLNNLGLEYFVSFKDITHVTTKNVISLTPNDTIFSAMQLMHSNNVSSIVIVDDLMPTGIITERDIVHLIRAETDLHTTLLNTVMSKPVLTASSSISALSAADLIRKNGVRRLVITKEDGSMIGIITETDIIKGLQSEYINQLKHVIDKQIVQLQTVRKQLNEKSIIETMLHSASDIAFVITGYDYQIIHSNKAAERLFGYTLQEAKELGIPKILEKEWDGQNSINLIIEQIQTNGKFSSTYQKKVDEVTYYVEVNIFGIKSDDEDFQGYVLIAKDISSSIETNKRLKNRSEELRETNAALRVLLKQRETDKEEITQSFQQNIETLVLPFFNKLRSRSTSPNQENIIKSIENNLRQITSPFVNRISNIYANLTPAEIQVANLIKNGHSSKEISSLLNLSSKTIYTHRRNIRKKSGITNQKTNLQSILQQVDY